MHGYKWPIKCTRTRAGYCSKGAAIPPGPAPAPLLPLDKAAVKRLAVVGPNADSAGSQLGQYECTLDRTQVMRASKL